MADARRLVVTADDFGFSEGIDRGIAEAAEAGIVRSASIMVTMPAFDDAVAQARRLPALGVGLHLTLTAGRPLTDAPTLISRSSGAFVGPRRLLQRALMGLVSRADVASECRAQIRRARSAGLRLTHLDAHHHAHTFPRIRDVVLEVARSEGIAFVRRPVESLRAPVPWRRVAERAVLAALSGSRRAPAPGAADHFAGVSLAGSRAFEAALLRCLDNLRPGTTELMVHPGYVDAPLPGGDPYFTEREAELRALLSGAVRARLAAGGIVVTNFAAVV
jgi:predicted glycoside hydrolase/deacetylase ChbG (UPF0249 family)